MQTGDVERRESPMGRSGWMENEGAWEIGNVTGEEGQRDGL